MARQRKTVAEVKLRNVWKCMIYRCGNPKYQSFHRYGGRGISVCDEWKTSSKPFIIWALDNGYKEGLSIDRIDNNLGYSPNNCKWSTRTEQSNNRHVNRKLVIYGEEKSVAEWSRDSRIGVNIGTINRRLFYGWSLERSVLTPCYQAEVLEAFREVKSYAEWTKDSRVTATENTIKKRLKTGMTPEQALTSLPKAGLSKFKEVQKIEAFGEVKSLSDWSKDPRCRVRATTIRSRIKSGKWSAEDAIKTPSREKSPSVADNAF